MLVIYGNISRVVFYQMQKKYMVSQSEASRGNSWGGGINP